MPQLNPEFFISQLFWLVVSFTFLFIFLWRISLPRIGSVLEKRANKIKEDIKMAKNYQAEAEEIQISINNQLRETKIETADLIKSANQKIQERTTKELEKLDNELNAKIDEVTSTIEKNKSDSFSQINNEIHKITRLTVSKISNIAVSDNDIKDIIKSVQEKEMN